MYVGIIVIALGTVAIAEGAAVISNGTCHSSYDCGYGMCCRSSSGHVITNQQLGGFGPHMGGVHQTGTCVVSPAAKHEMCDARCACGPGLACYRPMSGVCCPPMTCLDEDYVKREREHWANCFKDPSCAIPP